MIYLRGGPPLVSDLKLEVRKATPEELASMQAREDSFCRNEAWASAHWAEIVAQATGKHVAIAGERAFIADTGQDALAAARAAFPEDGGVLLRYVRGGKGSSA